MEHFGACGDAVQSHSRRPGVPALGSRTYHTRPHSEDSQSWELFYNVGLIRTAPRGEIR